MTTRWQSSPLYLAICSWLSNDIISVVGFECGKFARSLLLWDWMSLIWKATFMGRGAFSFFQSYPHLQYKDYLHELQTTLDPPRSARRSLPWLWGLQQTGKCTNECLRVLCFWNHSQVRNFQMPPIPQVLLSQLWEYLLKTFSFSWQTAM